MNTAHDPRRRALLRGTALSLGAMAPTLLSAPTTPMNLDPARLIPPIEPDEPYWAGVRDWFDAAGIGGYMNNGSLGPMPTPVVNAIDAQARSLAADPTDYEGIALREAVRERLGAFIGAAAYAASGQKWLLGGTGTGLCYLRPELQSRVWPLMGYRDPATSDPHQAGARRYELTGQKNLPAIAGLGAAVDFVSTIGRDTVGRRINELAGRLRTGLSAVDGIRLWTPTDPALSAGMTTFSVGLVPNTTVVRVLREQAGIHVIPMPVGGLNAVRVSTHCYNTPAQVDSLLAVVLEIADNELDYV